MTVKQALQLCDSFVDRSDPDTTLPNSLHMLQAAEACRAAGKPDWFVLCALLHDIGKLMYKWGSCEDGQGGRAVDPQWSLGGDTWVVGCPIPPCAVYPELSALNPDKDNPEFCSTPQGIYKSGCGMMSLKYAFGHVRHPLTAAHFPAAPLPSPPRALASSIAPSPPTPLILYTFVHRMSTHTSGPCTTRSPCQLRAWPSFACTAATPGTRARPTASSWRPGMRYWKRPLSSLTSMTCIPRLPQFPFWRRCGHFTRPSLTSFARVSWTGSPWVA